MHDVAKMTLVALLALAPAMVRTQPAASTGAPLSVADRAVRLQLKAFEAETGHRKDIIPGGPVGVDDTYRALAGTTLSVAAPGFLANDIDLGGEALTAIALDDDVDHGALAAFGDGRFDYTPNAGFTGVDSFVYRMRDASLNQATATVTIRVGVGNRAPLGTADRYAVVLNTTRVVAAPGFLANDIDPDGEALTAISIEDSPDHGAVVAFSDGRFDYTPAAGFTGIDSFAYRMRDASLNNSATITVTLEVYHPAPFIFGDGFE